MTVVLMYSAMFHIIFRGVEHSYPRVFPYRNKVVIYSQSIMDMRYYILYFTLYVGFLGWISLIMSHDTNAYWQKQITTIAFLAYVVARFTFPRQKYIKKQLDKIHSKSIICQCNILWKQHHDEFGHTYSPAFCHPGRHGKEVEINAFYYGDFFDCKGVLELTYDQTSPDKWYARIIESATLDDVGVSSA